MKRSAADSRSSLLERPPTWTPGLADTLQPREQLTVSDWADRNIVLGPDSAEPGPYRTERTPYAREWQDSAAVPWVRQVTIVASTQVGKSQSALNVMCYAITQEPGPMTVVLPAKEDATEFGENRLLPQMERHPALRAQIGGERFDAKKRQTKFRTGCRALFRSAITPKELAQYPAKWLFCEEVGKWRNRAGGEGSPFALARERTSTFWNHRIYLSSTPVLADDLISTEFERGDRRRYHVPCPHCGAFQVLVWKQVKWNKERDDTEAKVLASRDAWYECGSCKGRIGDDHKTAMLARGVWVPEGRELEEWRTTGAAADRAPHRSYHLWAGYSPWLAWFQLVAEWLKSLPVARDLQNFINSKLAEPWVQKVEDTKTSTLQACVGGYHRGDVPDGVLAVTGAVDVQKRFISYTLRGWGLSAESWLLDHGRCGEFAQLRTALFAPRPWPRGLRVRWVFMDARYRPKECIAFAKQHPQVALCRGVEFDDPVPYRMGMPIERHPVTGQPIGTLKPWHLNVCMFKDELAGAIRGAEGFGAFHVYEDVDPTYLEEMTSEHKILVEKGEKKRERWVPKAGHLQNHYWDTECYNRALAHRVGATTMRLAGASRRPPTSSSAGRDDGDGGSRLWRRT